MLKRVICKKTLVLMCLVRVFGTLASWKWIVWHRNIYFAKKILNYFGWGGDHSCKKCNICEAHIFSRSLVQNCWFETTSLCLNSRLCVRKKFQILIILIEIMVTLWLLCARTLMTGIYIHSRRPNNQENVSSYLVIIFHLIFIFHILRSWKTRFSHRSISLHELCT